MDLSAAPPIASPVAVRATLPQRAAAAAWFFGGVFLLGLAAWLTPDAHGTGTHQQLGMPPCSLLAVTGYPCATCGMTTAFAYAAHGHLIRSFLAQPLGALLAVFTAAMTLVSGYALAAGLPLSPVHRLIFAPRVIVVVAALGLAAWVYKILLVRGTL